MNQVTFRYRLRSVLFAAVALAMSVGRHTAKADPSASNARRALLRNDMLSQSFSPLTDFVVLISACSAYTGMAVKLAFQVEQPALAGMSGNGFGRHDLNAERTAVHNAWVNLTGKQMKDPPPTRELGSLHIKNGSTGAVGQVQVCGQRPDNSNRKRG